MRATPCPHALSHACVCARHTGACNMPWVQQRRCWRRTLRESSRERCVGDGAGGGSSEARRMLEGDDRRRMTRAGAERIGARKRVPVSVSATTTGKGPLARAGHLGERDAALTGLELLGRAGAYVPPSFSPQSLLSIYSLRSLPVLKGTQASTLWRVSSWSPSRSCSFRCVSPSPTTLTPTASLESTFDRLPLGCLLFTK